MTRLLDPGCLPTPLLARDERPAVAIAPPKTSRWRFLEFVGRVLVLLARLAVRKLRGTLSAGSVGAEVRSLIEAMGGLWIKTGQILSLRHDLYPIEFCHELLAVQDRANGFPPEIARQIVEEELGRPLDEVFSAFDDLPLAAASIGQVHHAVLRREGCRVAVKVQRPDVVRTFGADLKVIRFLLLSLDRWPRFAQMKLRELQWEIERIVVEELDYRREAENVRRMRPILRRHGIYVPRTWRRYNGRRILVLEYIDAVFMSDYLSTLRTDPERIGRWLAENEIDPDRVGRTLYQSFLRQMIEETYFHSDLHPGNIVLLRGGKVALIDFGAVGLLYNDFRRPLLRYFDAMRGRNYRKAVDEMLQFFEPLPHIDIADFKRDLLGVFRRWDGNWMVKSLPHEERSHIFLYRELGRVAMKHHVTLDWTFLRTDRANLTLNTSLMHLCRGFDFLDEIQRYFESSLGRWRRRALSCSRVAQFAGTGLAAANEGLRQMSMMSGDIEMLFQKSSISFEGTSSKIAFASAWSLSQFRGLAILAAGVLLVAFVDQHVVQIPFEATPISLDDHLHRIPPWTGIQFVGLIAILGFVTQILGRLANLFGKKEGADA